MAFKQRNLVADIANSARVTDPNLVNPWGIVVNDNLWVAINAKNLLNVYTKQGDPVDSISLADTPAPSGLAQIPNPRIGGAHYVFVTENGVVGTYNPSLQIPVTAVYTNPAAVYKGVTIQGNRVYAADLVGLKVDVFDLETFALIPSPDLVDAALVAAGYGPFNVYSDGETLFISYALSGGHDDVAGPGNGYINAWFRGNLIRLANRGALNSPWGMLVREDSLYVGNFGDGTINVFDLKERRADRCGPCILVAEYCRPLENVCKGTILIDGLWGLAAEEDRCGKFVIYFSAGVQDEAHGLVGSLTEIERR